MSQKVVIACRGWMTDPNAIASAPAGALRTARDVMIRIPNTIEPRPGFGVDSDFTPTTTTAIRSIIEWNDGSTNKYIVTNRTGATSYTFRYNDNTTISGAGFSYQSPADDSYYQHSYFVARGSLYVSNTDATGPQKLSSGSDTSFSCAPNEPIIGHRVGTYTAFTTTGAGLPIANGNSAAWRVVIRRKDGNGYITRSAPSNYIRHYNNSGSTAKLLASVRVPYDCSSGDVIEIYRAKQVVGDIAVADEMYFAAEYTITSTDITNGYAQISETVADENLGAALYTNASQQGILKANDTAPSACTAAYWSGCAWYGNALTRTKTQLKFSRVGGAFGDTTPYFGTHETTLAANMAMGATTLTIGTGAGADVHAGQGINQSQSGDPSAATAIFAANTLVTSYDSATGVVTFSPASLGALVATDPIVFHDHIRITGTATADYYAASSQNFATEKTFDTQGLTATAQETVEELAVINLASRCIMNVGSTLGKAHIIYPLGDGSFSVNVDASRNGNTVAISVPTDFSGAGVVPQTTVTPTQTWNSGSGNSPDDPRFVNRVYYSKPDEPEACPELNYISIGSGDHRILKLAPLRDSLLVFKEDGIWRISGSAPDQWRVDLVSSDYRLVHSRMATVLGETAYAWTNRGIISVSAYGDINNVDQAIHDQVEAVYLNNYSSLLTPTDTIASTMHAVTHERLGIVIFQMPARPTAAAPFVNPDSDSISGSLGNNVTTKFCYCYCPATQAWFEWDLRGDGTTASMFHKQSGKLYFARGGTSEVREERLSTYQGNGDAYYDATYAVTIGSASATGCTIAVGSTNYNYVQNDFLYQGSEYYRIGRNWALTAVILDDWSATGSATPISNGAATVYESIKPIIEWQAQSTGSAIGARWAEMGLHFSDINYSSDDTDDSFRLTIGGSADDDSSESTDGPAPTTPKNAVYRCWVPRSLHRSAKIIPFVSIYAVKMYWKIHGMTLVYQATSEKTRRDTSG